MEKVMEPFVVRPPVAAAVPLVVSIPHTGTHLPPEVARSLASDAMRALPLTDWHLHNLYDFLPALGITTIHATWSRFFIDLNRGPDDKPLYPGRFETGLIVHKTFQGEEVWARPPDADEVTRRRLLVHAPYHAKLRALLDESIAQFGGVVLIDAHSVASRASLLHGPLVEDIFLGNRDGATCNPALMDLAARAFTDEGYAVSRNQPYKGGYITDHYGRLPHVQALQIEMCQRVYLDESAPASFATSPRFTDARTRLRRIFSALIASLPVPVR